MRVGGCIVFFKWLIIVKAVASVPAVIRYFSLHLPGFFVLSTTLKLLLDLC